MSHPWRMRRGRAKVIRKCKYCGEDFCARDLQLHGPICPKRPKPFRGFRVVTCNRCGASMCAKAFQPHLRDGCQNATPPKKNHAICTICQEEKPVSDFYESIAHCYTCKACIKKHSSDRHAHPEVQQRAKFLSIKKLYGISQEDYERMDREQDGKCAICHEPPNGKHAKTDGLFVDHNHETHKVRQLLCHQCNHLVGNSRERIDLLLSAIDYLSRHSSPLPTVS